IEDKQLGLVKGVYKTAHSDTVQKGYGRCHLVKGNYYYFTIAHNSSGLALTQGDLLYTWIKKPPIYFGQVPKLASHCIELQDVYENPFYSINDVFSQWSETAEKTLLDSMVKDIIFT